MNPCVKEITKRDPSVKCSYCHRSEINSLEWGPMYQLAGISVHYFCMLFSAGLSQHGDDDEGILGFLPKDIRKELKRGEKLKCKFCRCVGATIGCSTKSCKTSYHYPCGLEKNSVFQFIGNFESYCEKHREKFNIPYADIDNKCPICYEEVYATDIPLWPPCCKKRIFHKNCIMEMAKNHAAHFFKCPLCNDKDIFSVAMRKSGVYLPDRDATWELEPNAFAEHAEVYSRCDADICRCPKGREYSSSSDSKPYKIVRCGACGAAAVHKRCGNLKNLTWRCQTCADILSDKRKSENLNSSRIRRQRYDTSEDEDASDTEEVLKLRDVISTVPPVQPQPVNDRIIIERSLFEENLGSRFVVERAETDDSDSEDDNDEDYFISSRSRTFASKLREKVSHRNRIKSKENDSGPRDVLKQLNTHMTLENCCISGPSFSGHEIGLKVQNTSSVSTLGDIETENRMSRFDLYTKKLNDVKCCRQNASTTKDRSIDSSMSSDNVSSPVHSVSPGNTAPIIFPPLTKNKLIKVDAKANFKQVHQPVTTNSEPEVIRESAIRKIKISSENRNTSDGRGTKPNGNTDIGGYSATTKRDNVTPGASKTTDKSNPRDSGIGMVDIGGSNSIRTQRLDVVELEDDSGSDLEIVSEKVVNPQSSALREIVAKARQKPSKPVVNIGVDDDQHDDIEFEQINKLNPPTPMFPSNSAFPISAAFLNVIQQVKKKSSKSYFSGRLAEKRSIEVVSLDTDEEEHDECSGSSNSQGETRTCSKQRERLTTDPSRDSNQTQAKRARN